MATSKPVLITNDEVRDSQQIRIFLRDAAKNLDRSLPLIPNVLSLTRKVGPGNFETEEGHNRVLLELYELRDRIEHFSKNCHHVDQEIGKVLNLNKEGKLYVVTHTVRKVSVGSSRTHPVQKKSALDR